MDNRESTTMTKNRSFRHIASLIKNKRHSHPRGYSQSELSNLLGYKNGQFISNVERGLCNVPLKMLNRICEILSINEKELKSTLLKDYEQTLNSYLAAQAAGEGPQSLGESMEDNVVDLRESFK